MAWHVWRRPASILARPLCDHVRPGHESLLPGPEAQQLATYIGWLLHGVRGGLCAGLLFILPGFVAILALSVLYALFRDVGPVVALLFGLKAAVLAIVVEAVIRVGKRVLKNPVMLTVAAAAFVAIPRRFSVEDFRKVFQAA